MLFVVSGACCNPGGGWGSGGHTTGYGGQYHTWRSSTSVEKPALNLGSPLMMIIALNVCFFNEMRGQGTHYPRIKNYTVEPSGAQALHQRAQNLLSWTQPIHCQH